MVIVYMSGLGADKRAGLSYSIPAQVTAQKKYDDVLWLNFKDESLATWQATGVYLARDGYKKFSFSSLPAPFDKPDLVIWESFYNKFMVSIYALLKKQAIPYIIVPRGAMTVGAQKQKRLKKVLGNLLLFDKIAKDALAIQYLTADEQASSGRKWNSNSFIIPNGVSVKAKPQTFKTRIKKLVFIARFNIYHKGLDILIDACQQQKELLLAKKCSIDLYGAADEIERQELLGLVKAAALEEIIAVHGGVFDSEKIKILQAADIFLLTSRFEGLPMGLLEAMSYGLPCLITRGSNMKEVVEQHNAGWTTEDNAESVALAIEQMFNSEDDMPSFSQNAYQLSLEYSWDNLAKQAHDKYQKLLK